MTAEIIVTDEFRVWYEGLTLEAQKKIVFVVNLLSEQATALGHPYSSKIQGSRHSGMRELRTTQGGDPYRVLYIFDPARSAVLLVGGTKIGKGNRWYEPMKWLADRLYNEILAGKWPGTPGEVNVWQRTGGLI